MNDHGPRGVPYREPELRDLDALRAGVRRQAWRGRTYVVDEVQELDGDALLLLAEEEHRVGGERVRLKTDAVRRLLHRQDAVPVRQ